MSRDTWWCCEYCGNIAAAEPPYVVGDSEPCVVCSEGVARVMTLSDATRLEYQISISSRKRRKAYS